MRCWMSFGIKYLRKIGLPLTKSIIYVLLNLIQADFRLICYLHTSGNVPGNVRQVACLIEILIHIRRLRVAGYRIRCPALVSIFFSWESRYTHFAYTTRFEKVSMNNAVIYGQSPQ